MHSHVLIFHNRLIFLHNQCIVGSIVRVHSIRVDYVTTAPPTAELSSVASSRRPPGWPMHFELKA